MIERAYKLTEIDAMRAALISRNNAYRPEWMQNGNTGEMFLRMVQSDDENVLRHAATAAEDQLRTYMMAGIEPAEVIQGVTAQIVV